MTELVPGLSPEERLIHLQGMIELQDAPEAIKRVAERAVMRVEREVCTGIVTEHT